MPSFLRLVALLLLAMPLLALAAPTVGSRDAPSKLQPRAPQASKRMGQRRRRTVEEPKQKKDYSSFLCPGGSVACPVSAGEVTPESAAALETSLSALADWFKVGFECIELDTELNQCGGCLALGKGQDCSTIANAHSTACEKGACVVLQCKDGFVVSSDRAECVRPGGDDAQAVLRR